MYNVATSKWSNTSLASSSYGSYIAMTSMSNLVLFAGGYYTYHDYVAEITVDVYSNGVEIYNVSSNT